MEQSKYHYWAVYEQNQLSKLQLPWGAALNPWTNLGEFSLKNRWRYMIRTSAWQLRFRMSTESVISRENPSAARRPRLSSLSIEKSLGRRVRERPSQTLLHLMCASIHDDMRKWCVCTLSVSAVIRGWYRRSRALATWKHQFLFCSNGYWQHTQVLLLICLSHTETKTTNELTNACPHHTS